MLQKKFGRYDRIYLQLIDLLKKSNNPISNMATIAAVLSGKMDLFFSGLVFTYFRMANCKWVPIRDRWPVLILQRFWGGLLGRNQYRKNSDCGRCASV